MRKEDPTVTRIRAQLDQERAEIKGMLLENKEEWVRWILFAQDVMCGQVEPDPIHWETLGRLARHALMTLAEPVEGEES